MGNPFQITKPVDPSEVIDREAEASQLVDLAYEGNNARVVAPRRYGKTSLVQRVQAQLEDEGWLTVYVDLFGIVTLEDVASKIEHAYSESLKGPLARWFAGVRRSLSPKVRLGGGAVPAAAEVDLGAQREALMSLLALPVRVHEKTGQRVHVAFDEFQELDHLPDRPDALVRSEIQHHGDAASYVFAGSQVRMMEMMFADRSRAFYGQTQPVTLRRLEDEPLAEYIGDRFSTSGKEIAAPALRALLDFVHGHPQRAMVAAHALWAVADGVADLESWELAYRKVMADVADEMRTLWGQLGSPERRVLVNVAAGGGPFQRRDNAPRGSVVARAVEELEGRGLLLRVGGGWEIVDPLLGEWLRLGRTAP